MKAKKDDIITWRYNESIYVFLKDKFSKLIRLINATKSIFSIFSKPKFREGVSLTISWETHYIQWGETKNDTLSKCHIFLKNDPISIIFLVKIRTDYKFFLHIFSSP